MKLTVYDRKANTLTGQRDRLANLIESETRFGMGCEFKQHREHNVMDEDWREEFRIQEFGFRIFG